MKFMLLIYEDDAERVEMMDERMPNCSAYARGDEEGRHLRDRRPRCAASAPRPACASRDGKTHVVDGPYAEAKEQLGGFHIIDVPDLDTALAWAARCPSASRGLVEVRPVWPV